VELVAARVTVETPAPEIQQRIVGAEGPGVEPLSQREVYFSTTGEQLLTPVYRREGLPVGHRLVGPAIIEQYDATTVIPPGWEAVVDEMGNLVLSART
jgi:N-methylhydantoinase A